MQVRLSLALVVPFCCVDDGLSGYQSTASADFLKKLREPTDNHLPVHARPLGNTVYWMSSVNTPRSTLEQVEAAILAALV